MMQMVYFDRKLCYTVVTIRKDVDKTEPIIVSSFQTVIRHEPKETHWHHQLQSSSLYVVAYLINGVYEHIFEGQSYILSADSVMIYHGSDAYEVFEREHGHCIAAHFCTAKPVDLRFTILDGGSIPQIKADFLRLYKAYNRRDEYSWCDSAMYLYSILGKIRRAIDSKDDYIQHQKYANIMRARDYLAENFSDPNLSLNEAANVAEVSQRRFGELFRRLYHITPGHFITRLRISAAEDMLRMKNYTIAEIAASVGYASPGYFCRVFVRETGVAPSRWLEREQLR